MGHDIWLEFCLVPNIHFDVELVGLLAAIQHNFHLVNSRERQVKFKGMCQEFFEPLICPARQLLVFPHGELHKPEHNINAELWKLHDLRMRCCFICNIL